jgi:hypothetical protein
MSARLFTADWRGRVRWAAVGERNDHAFRVGRIIRKNPGLAMPRLHGRPAEIIRAQCFLTKLAQPSLTR